MRAGVVSVGFSMIRVTWKYHILIHCLFGKIFAVWNRIECRALRSPSCECLQKINKNDTTPFMRCYLLCMAPCGRVKLETFTRTGLSCHVFSAPFIKVGQSARNVRHFGALRGSWGMQIWHPMCFFVWFCGVLGVNQADGGGGIREAFPVKGSSRTLGAEKKT